MLKYVQLLANDMMDNMSLNALVNEGDLNASDEAIKKIIASINATREEVAKDMGGVQNAVALGMLPESAALPLNVCGTVANVICQLFLNSVKFNYRFNFKDRTQEDGYCNNIMLLGAALKKRDGKQSYLLRVDCTSHSYVLYLPPSKNSDEAYLIQANCAECMEQFTLQEWMNSKKATTVRSLSDHFELLTKIADLKEVALNPYKKGVSSFFAFIPENPHKKYTHYKPTNMDFVFRAFDEKIAYGNFAALYKRAGLNAP